jgi:hypothetical protein
MDTAEEEAKKSKAFFEQTKLKNNPSHAKQPPAILGDIAPTMAKTIVAEPPDKSEATVNDDPAEGQTPP